MAAEVHQDRILIGLLSAAVDAEVALERIVYATANLDENLFDGPRKAIYQVMVRYYQKTGGRIGSSVLVESLERAGVDSDTSLDYQVKFGGYVDAEFTEEHVFKYYCSALVEEVRRERFGLVLADSAEILVKGKVFGSSRLHGLAAARSYLNERLSELDQLTVDGAPEAALDEEVRDVLDEYETFKTTHNTGILTGFGPLDERTNGLMPGELFLVAGYTAEGKSFVAANIAAEAALQGKAVVVATIETLRHQYRRRILCRLAKAPRFGFPEGISLKAFKEGALSPQEEACLRAVLAALPSMGKITVFQVPRFASIDWIESKVKRMQQNGEVDLFVLDEARLLTPPRRRQSLREELNDVLIGLKRMATDANNGRGTVVLSPYQVSRTAYQEALKRRYYGKDCMAECAEAERSADLILSLLRDPESPDSHKIFARVLKYRDGEDLFDFTLSEEFDKGYIGSEMAVSERDLFDV
jgi:RecA/RadA recombinase